MTHNVFQGLDKLQELSISLDDITGLVIRHDKPDVEIEGDTIFAPPEYEVMLSYLLMNSHDT